MTNDALEKMRYLQLTDEQIQGNDLQLEINIATDEEKHTLNISDTGIGMTKEELVENLGTDCPLCGKKRPDTSRGEYHGSINHWSGQPNP